MWIQAGWCNIHRIKGDRTTRKIKKYEYGWVTSTLVEYVCRLGCSDYPGSEVVMSDVSDQKAALTNSKEPNQIADISRDFIGCEKRESIGLEGTSI